MDSDKGLLVDRFGRTHTYLRLSVTDVCDYRCPYCGSTTSHPGLSDDRLVELATLLHALGIQKLRITGGEPTLRPNLDSLIARLSALGFSRIAMTTNGRRLSSCASTLHSAGLEGVNVSLDALDVDLYARMTGGFSVEPVLEGIEAALEAGLSVKLNCVPLAETYEEQVPQVVSVARKYRIPIRFIELMPFGDGVGKTGVSPVVLSAFLESLTGEPAFLSSARWGMGPATYRKFGDVEVGFIGAMTSCFCAGCNRLRLSSRGQLYRCLCDTEFLDLATLVESNADFAYLASQIQKFVLGKHRRHDLDRTPEVDRPLSSIGG